MDDDQQFCLRWNNHQSTLISVFDTLLENGTLVDCTLAAEGKFLKAHKVVLSACSPYFAALLSQQYDKHPIFILKDVKFQELRAMMDYMYRGEVNISQDQLAALLKAAESLQIKGLSDNRSNSVPNKADNLVKPPPPVPAGPKGGLTISDAKRKQLLGGDLDTDLSTVTREGSTSPSRKRKKIGRRRSIDANNVLDNHEQHSNSSSHSHTTPHIAAAGAIAANAGNVTNNIATSTPIVLPVTKKTDHDQNKTADAAGIDSAAEHVDDHHHEQANNARKDGKRNTAGDETHSELMIEPKNEYDDDEDDEGNEPVEDLTLDDEDMMDDMDQAGPSHGGEGSSSGYGNWPMERSQDEGFMGQDGGQPRDAQGTSKTDPSKDVLTLADLNDCLLESNDIVVSKTKKGIVLLRLKKDDDLPEQQIGHQQVMTLKKDEKGGVMFKECDDLTITKIAGLTWSEWNARLAMPLVQTLREGPHPLVFSRDFGAGSVGSLDKLGTPGNNNSGGGGTPGTPGSGSGGGIGPADQTPQFACPDCGRMYKLKSSLRNHQKWECGKEPQFQCPYCVYRAKQKMHIGRHMERMHKERFFKVESDKVVALDMGGAVAEADLANAMNMNLLNMNMNMKFEPNNTC